MGFPLKIDIGNDTYEVVEKENETASKGHPKTYIDIFLKSNENENENKKLDDKRYTCLKRRLYNTIKSIDSLSNGKTRYYEIFYKFELEFITKYLEQQNILHRVQVYNTEKHYYQGTVMGRIFIKNSNIFEEKVKQYFNGNNDLLLNKYAKPFRVRIRVYKGYVNICEYPRNKRPEVKFGIKLLTDDVELDN